MQRVHRIMRSVIATNKGGALVVGKVRTGKLWFGTEKVCVACFATEMVCFGTEKVCFGSFGGTEKVCFRSFATETVCFWTRCDACTE